MENPNWQEDLAAGRIVAIKVPWRYDYTGIPFRTESIDESKLQRGSGPIEIPLIAFGDDWAEYANGWKFRTITTPNGRRHAERIDAIQE
jgi:hypothetical protein